MSSYKDYLSLTKPRILVMVLITTAMGYFLGGKGIHSWVTLSWLLFGTALSCGGAAALNNFLERDIDRHMPRTKNRALPSGRIAPQNAMLFGIILSLVGTSLLVIHVNLLSGFLALLTVFLYVFLYTPMKRTSALNTVVGAIPGALPPMGGWVAATGSIDLGAWILFGILFLWQHPHFFAIAWMYKEDYALGGFKMLPNVDETGQKTFTAIMISTLALIPISILPTFFGLAGVAYGVGVLGLGLYVLHYGWVLTKTKERSDARKLLYSTLIYLPVLLILFVTDAQF